MMNLNYKEDGRSILFLIIGLVLLIVPFFGYWDNIYVAVLRWVFVVIGFSINHSHQHVALFNSEKWNKLIGVLISLDIGQAATSVIVMHNINHHGHNNSDQDLANTRLVSLRWNLINLIIYPFLVIWNYRKKRKELLTKLCEKSAGIKHKIFLEKWVVRGFILITMAINLKVFFLFVLVPYAAGLWVVIASNLVQHQMSDSYPGTFEATNFTGWLYNYLLLNSGYHSAHHRNAKIHWSRLPAHHQSIKASLPPVHIQKYFSLYLIRQYLLRFSPVIERKVYENR